MRFATPLAHGFTPEQRREYKNTGKAMYDNVDISTTQGLAVYDRDVLRLHDYLFQMAFGKRLASFASRLRGPDEPREVAD
jgi:hypothetical protein